MLHSSLAGLARLGIVCIREKRRVEREMNGKHFFWLEMVGGKAEGSFVPVVDRPLASLSSASLFLPRLENQ